MIDTKKLRRLAQEATPGPWKMLPVGDGRQKFAVADSEFLSILTVTDEGDATFGTVYDDADAKFIAAANPAAITELLDRLEAAESELLEEARLNGMGSEREASLMAKLEAAEKERDALRAKIEAMEKQEPFDADSDVFRGSFEAALKAGNWPATRQGDGYRSPSTQIAWRIAFSTINRLKLYALPGAKGE